MLTAISPVDGRYASKVKELQEYFSEFGLIKYRTLIEIEYFIALSSVGLQQFPELTLDQQTSLRKIYQDFSVEDASAIKEIEKTTNHDVKAVEYFLRDQFDTLGFSEYKEWIHFGLTSQDINNTALPLLVKDAMSNVYIPLLEEVRDEIEQHAKQYEDQAMLARTHGQPASPTTMGKEWKVYLERIDEQLNQLKSLPVKGKFGGATGNFNAHLVTFPEVDWRAFGDDFVRNLGIERSFYTTQIAHYDHLASLFHSLVRINNIWIDFSRDIWSYISMEYFKQKTIAGEVGSSAMPHKVNPIDFENAEGNLAYANAIFEFLARKLPISRLQRDLTDSTVTRNIGVPVAHTVIALKSMKKGLSKLMINNAKLDADLEDNWAVVAEAIQNILRREMYPHPYEALKTLTRGKGKIDQQIITEFIDSLDVPETIKNELKKISPHTYIGYK